MGDISILRIRINYSDLEVFTLVFLQVHVIYPLILIAALFLLKNFIFWFLSFFNRNSIFSYLRILINKIRRARYWGIIYDSKRLSPVRFARVKLIKFEKQGEKVVKKIVGTTISDYLGRYYFNYKGEYKNLFLEVNSFGYKRFYKEIDTLKHIELNNEIIFDAALVKSKQGFNLSKFAYFVNFIFVVLTLFLAGLGLIVSIYYQLSSIRAEAFIFTAIYVFILYINITNLLKRFTLKKLEVLESLLMHKIPGAVVRLYDKKNNLHFAVTNKDGYVLLDWEPGAHQIIVTKRGYQILDDNTGTEDKKTWLTHTKHVRLKRKFKNHTVSTTDKDIKIKPVSSLNNPFTA